MQELIEFLFYFGLIFINISANVTLVLSSIVGLKSYIPN